MTERILDFSEQPAHLSVRNGLLVVRPQDGEQQTMPLEDIAVLVAAHPQVTFTLAVISGIAGAGGLLIACDEKRQPAALMLPLATHYLQTERYAAQAQLGLPARKRLWQQIVRAKIAAQARVLEEKTGSDRGLAMMAGRVRSGDAGNLEAHAARLYWPALLGESFRRLPEGDGVNPLLNYGYAVLRAMVARAICAAGLHPTFGLHHRNRYDTFCLADDLMEPFRPLVDRVAAQLAKEQGDGVTLDREAKRALLEPLLGRFSSQQECRTLFDWVARCAFSLAAVVDGSAAKLEIPVIRDA
ncbi:MAG: type II CRISPR-associated endonuclease Cas1 [Terriglobia bacterium]